MIHSDHLLSRWQTPGFSFLERRSLKLSAGRGLLQLVQHPMGVLVERTYRHGGLRRFLLPQIFMKCRRPALELERHCAAHTAGLATVEPVGWSEQRFIVPGIRRYFYYTLYDPDAMPLPKHFKGRSRSAILAQMAAILHKLYRLRIHHHDLNLNNWLVARDRLLLIDFDGARLVDWDAAVFLHRCLARIARSGKKLGFAHLKYSFFRLAILSSRLFGLEARRVLCQLPATLQRVSVVDRMRWRLSGGHQILNP